MAKSSMNDIIRRREKVEALMLMEFTRGQIIDLMPNVAERTLERDMSDIRKKWQEDAKDLTHRDQLREQMLRKAKKAENKAWQAEAKAAGQSEKVGAIRAALDAQERQSKLLGLDASRQEGSISLETMNRVLEQLGMEVVNAAQEVIPDADTRAALLQSIEERWAAIKFEPGKPGSKRSS